MTYEDTLPQKPPECSECGGSGLAHDLTSCSVCGGSGVNPDLQYIPEGYYFRDDLDGGRLVKKDR